MGTQIVKPNAQQHVQFNAELERLKKEADAIVISDAATCLSAKHLQKTLRNYVKDVHLKLDPFVESAKRNWDDARTELKSHVEPAESIDDSLGDKVKKYERDEQMKAEAERRREQQRLDDEAKQKAADQRIADEKAAKERREQAEREIKERQKAGDISKAEATKALKDEAKTFDSRVQQAAVDANAVVTNVPKVKVEAAIPKVSGVPTHQVNWKFKITDRTRIPRLYMKPDEVEIGTMVRKTKDKAKAEAICPGIEVWSD